MVNNPGLIIGMYVYGLKCLVILHYGCEWLLLVDLGSAVIPRLVDAARMMRKQKPRDGLHGQVYSL